MEGWIILISIVLLVFVFLKARKIQLFLDRKNVYIATSVIKLFAVLICGTFIIVSLYLADQSVRKDVYRKQDQALKEVAEQSKKDDTQKQIDLINLEKQKKDYMTDEEAIQARKEYERKKQEEYNSIYERIISYSELHFVKSFSDIKQFLVIIKDTENAILMGGDSDIKEKTKKSLSSFQKINFPLARKMYYNNAKEKLWEKNIEVKLSGRDITFEGYMFADNGTIKATYEEIRKEVEDLRFETVGFRWYEGGGRTYWKLNVKNDGEI